MVETVTALLAVAVLALLIAVVVMGMRGRRKSSVPDPGALEDRFKSIAADILDSNAAKFKESATEPMRNLMTDLQNDIRRLQDQSVQNTTIMQTLEKHTTRLSTTLSNSRMRGAFGEMMMEKWFDAAGLQRGVHYETQVALPDGSRPDFVVYMPDNRCIILDSKVPLDRLAGAFDDADEERQAGMFKEHRRAVRNHITKLGSRKYTAQDIPPPGSAHGTTTTTTAARTNDDVTQPVEYIIMVVPEYALAPVMDTEMINFAQERGIILATPSMTVLVANVVHMMWRQRDMSQNVRRVIAKAATLQNVIEDFATAYDGIGASVKTLKSRYEKGEKILNESVRAVSTELHMASSVAAGELSEGTEGSADGGSDGEDHDDTGEKQSTLS